MLRTCLLLLALSVGFGAFSQSTLKLKSHTIQLKKRTPFELKIPAGYKIAIAAQGLERPRFFAKSPDGRIFITDMHNRSDNKLGRILILENWNEKEKKFETVTTYLDKFYNPVHNPENLQ